MNHTSSELTHPCSLDTSALMAITPRPSQVMVAGEGSYLFDADGKRYLDLVQGWAVNALGHCPAEIVDALSTQSRRLITPSPALHNAPLIALTQALARASGLSQVHVANSGSDANEAAVKLARKWGQKHRGGAFEVLTTVGAFHGRTLAMMSASGKPGWDQMFPPMPQGFTKVPYGDLAAMRAALGPNTVALMVEPIQGEAGVIVPPENYLRGLRDIANECGVLLILDEVQTGIGRTGAMFAYQHAGILPDILTLAKGLGGGVPVSAMIASEHACCFEYGDQGGTYNGNPLMAAVASAVVSAVNTPQFLEHVRSMGERMRTGLSDLVDARKLRSVRGQGLLLAAQLNDANAEAVRDNAFDRGLLINAPQPDALRFMPSLRISAHEVDEALGVLNEVLEEIPE